VVSKSLKFIYEVRESAKRHGETCYEVRDGNNSGLSILAAGVEHRPAL